VKAAAVRARSRHPRGAGVTSSASEAVERHVVHAVLDAFLGCEEAITQHPTTALLVHDGSDQAVEGGALAPGVSAVTLNALLAKLD
jgi:hypothetical protein